MQNNDRCVRLVCPRLGIDSPGNCLPGPYRPFGMVRLSPDIFFPQRSHGYRHGAPILRFSHTHVAGTGGFGRYGNIGLTPFTGAPKQSTMPPFICPPWQRNADAIPHDERAEVGWYAVTMRPWNVEVALTCTRHVGLHRYRYPAGSDAWLLLDAASVIQVGRSPAGQFRGIEDHEMEAVSLGGWLEIASPTALIGRSDFRGGWGHDKCYSIFFYVQLDQPIAEAIFANSAGLVPAGEGRQVVGSGCRALLRFPAGSELNVQVGISFVSVAKARSHVASEVRGRGMEAIRRECEDEWEQWLRQFSIEGGTDEQRRLFYSLLYRLLCMPTDLGIDDENPYWHSGVRQFTDYYCLWDSIRNANSFYHLFYPELSRDLLNSLLDIAEHTGWLPDAYIAMQHGYLQGACGAEVLFSEAALKGITGVDYASALAYMRKNNEAASPEMLTKGRYREDYHALGYLSTNVSKGSISRHLEYTYHDWCIARLAAQLGDRETTAEYLHNSLRVWNLWRDDLKAFAPRRPDGAWVAGFDPWRDPPESWNDPYCYEGSAIVWSMNVLQDLHGLIVRVGSTEAMQRLLDRLFDEGLFQIKETRMHIPHLYTYAGRPDRAADRVLATLAQYDTTPSGLPDNEDMGCQSAYYLWNSLGLYPIYGQGHYLLTPPLFDRVEAPLGETGKRLVITATRRGSGRYITGVRLGGTPLDRAWITHQELLEAGELQFELDDIPSDWGTTHPPPNADYYTEGYVR